MNFPEKYDLTKCPENGCYLYGFFVEGGSWNREKNYIDEPIPKILYPHLPYVWFKPIKKVDLKKREVYECPVYRTSKRQGELNTSGQSTNFIISFCKLNSNIDFEFDKNQFTIDHWVKRGTAILTTLNE